MYVLHTYVYLARPTKLICIIKNSETQRLRTFAPNGINYSLFLVLHYHDKVCSYKKKLMEKSKKIFSSMQLHIHFFDRNGYR